MVFEPFYSIPLQLATGFGLALSLVVLVILLLHHGIVTGDSIHGLGILDVIWMSRRHMEFDWEKIADAPVPLTDDLRRRGRDVEVDLSHLLRSEAKKKPSKETERM